MRPFVLIAVASAASLATADRLVFVPSGRKLPQREARLEVLWEAATGRNTHGYLAFGLTRTFEIALTTETVDPRGTLASLDVSFAVVDPIVNFVPGLTVGVLDLLNHTADGRSFFIATAYDIGLTGEFNGGSPMKLTVGAIAGGLNGPFVGVQIPFTGSVIGIAEHNSREVTAGVEIRPSSDSSIRWLFSGDRVLWSLGYTTRF